MKYKICEDCYYYDLAASEINEQVCSDCSGNDTDINSRFASVKYCRNCKNTFDLNTCIECKIELDGHGTRFERIIK